MSQFCFISDEFYKDFPDKNIMNNKETVNGQMHKRPCFFVFGDVNNSSIKWLVPLSTRFEKYEAIHDSKMKKYGKCDTIHLATFLGKKQAFLIQNMFPITEKYILNYFNDKHNIPIQLSGLIEKAVTEKACTVLKKHYAGVKLIFPDVDVIYQGLFNQLSINKDRKLEDISLKERIAKAQEKANELNSKHTAKEKAQEQNKLL